MDHNLWYSLYRIGYATYRMLLSRINIILKSRMKTTKTIYRASSDSFFLISNIIGHSISQKHKTMIKCYAFNSRKNVTPAWNLDGLRGHRRPCFFDLIVCSIISLCKWGPFSLLSLITSEHLKWADKFRHALSS